MTPIAERVCLFLRTVKWHRNRILCWNST